MTVSIDAANGIYHAKVTGDMTIYHAAEIKDELWSCLEHGTELEIDLSDVSEIDTAGYQLLLLVKREADSAGKAIRLIGYGKSMLKMLRLLDVEPVPDKRIIIKSGAA